MIRLDRFLCDMKEGSRSEVKALIRRGAVCVNGNVEKNPERKVSEEDQISLSGRQIRYRKYVYLLLNKPAGLLSATRDGRETTVLDLVREKGGGDPLLKRDLFPVGRLDRDTEGLLLLTDDGALSHRLLAPSGHVPKTYYVEVDGELTAEHRRMLETGVDIGEARPTGPARIAPAQGEESGTFRSKEARSAWRLVITEGKFHQVKRMMQAVGRKVVYLKRTGMGGLELDPELKTGEFRMLTEEEYRSLAEEAPGREYGE